MSRKRKERKKAPDWVPPTQTWTDEPHKLTQAHTGTRLKDWKARLHRRSKAWKAKFKLPTSLPDLSLPDSK